MERESAGKIKYKKEGYCCPLLNVNLLYRLTKLLASFGLSILSFRGCRYSLGMRGSYRKLVSFPRGLKWRIRSPEASPAAPVTSSAAAAAGNGGLAVPITPTSTQKPCLEMIFRLDNGSYVTTLLNEILHFKH